MRTRKKASVSRAAVTSVSLHGVLVAVLWGTITLAARPADPAPAEFRGVFEAAAPSMEPPLPPPDPAPPPEAAEPDPRVAIEERPALDSRDAEPLFEDLSPPTAMASPVALPSAPCRAIGIVPRRVRPAAPPPPPVYAPAPVRMAPAPPAGPTTVACPVEGNRPPDYPERAASAGLEGVVVLVVLVGPDGAVRDVRLKSGSGHALLDREAIRAVRDWRFRPALERGVPVSAEIEVPVRFRLR